MDVRDLLPIEVSVAGGSFELTAGPLDCFIRMSKEGGGSSYSGIFPPSLLNALLNAAEAVVEAKYKELDFAAQKAANVLYNLAQNKALCQFDRATCKEVSESIDRARGKASCLRKQVGGEGKP